MIHFFAKGTKATRGIHRLFVALVIIALEAPCVTYAQRAPLRVLTTTGIIGSTTSQIAGADIIVETLMGPGIDPHLYKPSPGDLRKLSEASLVLYNGLHLEGKMSELLEKLGSRKPVVAVAASLPQDKLRATDGGISNMDPHVWLDVELWTTAAQRIRDALIQLDPPHAEGYTSRFSALQTDLLTLHNWCKTEIGTIPEQRRILVTAHDAFGYFSRAYQIQVLSIQGITTDSEASLREINTLVKTLVTRDIPAVFIETTISPKTVQALIEGARAAGHHVKIGGELFSDSLGDINMPTGSYQGMMRHNVTTIVQALRGVNHE